MYKKQSICGQIEEYIEAEIASGRKKCNDQLPTENELSQMFHTSRATVVKALDKLAARNVIYRIKGSGSYVSPEDATVVPNHTKSRIISLILPYAADANSIAQRSESQIIRGCEQCATSNGYFLTVTYTGSSIQEERKAIELCKTQMSRGAIFCPGTLEQDITDFFNIVFDDFPMVLLDNPYTIPSCTYVLSNNIQGGYQAAQRLMACGYEKLCFVSDSLLKIHASVQERFAGFSKFIIESKMSLDESVLIDGFAMDNGRFLFRSYEYDPLLYQNVLMQIIGDSSKKCGILCKTDEVAVNLLKAALQLGIDIPNQLGIMGYGNTLINSPMPLSSIGQDYYGIGNEATRILLDWVERDVHKPSIKYMNTNFIQGDTTIQI